MAYWCVKNEPNDYSYFDLEKDGRTDWDGVRNYQARNNLQKMEPGDLSFFYHSVNEKRIVGVMRVTKAAYQDPTTEDERWVAVEFVPVKRLEKPVELKTIKATDALQEIALVKQSRLSVMPLEESEFNTILELGETRLPKDA